jgi:hypothetical protein
MRHGKMALNLWTDGEEAMAEAATQAAGGRRVIYVHTAACRGGLKGTPTDNGNMWIASPGQRDIELRVAELFDFSPPGYQRLPAD